MPRVPAEAAWIFDEYDAPRFWSRVDFHGGYGFLDDPLARVGRDAGECWQWTGWERNGYGHFTCWGQRLAAHRLAYRDFNRVIPEGFEIDHLCRNTMCVRPDHLEPVEHIENQARGLGPLLNRSVCKNGHELTPDNIRVFNGPSGSKRFGCKACRKIQAAEGYRRRLASTK